MGKKNPERLKEIYAQVQKMDYSIDNMLELVSLFKETIRIAKKSNPYRSKNECLNSLLNTHDQEFIEMIAKDINNEEDRKAAFNEFISNFLCDLSMNCFK
jgi:uncharacterized protein YjgD (DUF1641 family)